MRLVIFVVHRIMVGSVRTALRTKRVIRVFTMHITVQSTNAVAAKEKRSIFLERFMFFRGTLFLYVFLYRVKWTREEYRGTDGETCH